MNLGSSFKFNGLNHILTSYPAKLVQYDPPHRCPLSMPASGWFYCGEIPPQTVPSLASSSLLVHSYHLMKYCRNRLSFYVILLCKYMYCVKDNRARNLTDTRSTLTTWKWPGLSTIEERVLCWWLSFETHKRKL